MAKRVVITVDRVNQVIGSLQDLVGKQVLVGIPEQNSARQDEDSGPMTNAALGYVHETGSPASNLPARPFLVPSAKESAPQYTPHLRGAAAAALEGDTARSDRELIAAGIVAEQAAKRKIHSNIPPPLSPSTIRQRRRSRDTQSRRESEELYMRLVKSGVAPGAAQDEAGIISLINTGQLANAITSVVRKIGKKFRQAEYNSVPRDSEIQSVARKAEAGAQSVAREAEQAAAGAVESL